MEFGIWSTHKAQAERCNHNKKSLHPNFLPPPASKGYVETSKDVNLRIYIYIHTHNIQGLYIYVCVCNVYIVEHGLTDSIETEPNVTSYSMTCSSPIEQNNKEHNIAWYIVYVMFCYVILYVLLYDAKLYRVAGLYCTILHRLEFGQTILCVCI